MHCPRCGQQQISEETKFCSRCGFSLALISEILANGGTLPQLLDLYNSKGILTRRNGIIFGGLWMFIWVLLITPIIAISGGGEIAGIGGVLGIFGGILIMMMSAFFLKPAPNPATVNFSSSTANQLSQPSNQQALPPQQSIPTSAYVAPTMGSWRETNDLVEQPTSVTDGTTKLLEKDK